MSIPFFTLAPTLERQQPLLDRYVNELFERCDFVNGKLVGKLEDAIKRYTAAKHAIAVGNASDGLTCALEAAGVRACDEVIVPAFTFVSSASSIVHAGARPVFADIDRETYGFDPDSVRKAITDKTRALMVVHLFHQPALMSELLSVAEEHKLIVVEDSAEAIGMQCEGNHCGLAGKAGVLSFFPTKTLGCVGDGGMIITNADEVAAACRELRDHGRKPGGTGVSLRPGHSSRLDSIQAAVLLARLEVLDEEIARRSYLANLYSERLSQLAPRVRVPRFVTRSYPSSGVWYVFVIEGDRRDQLAEFLAAQGIITEIYYPLPLHLQPAFADFGHRAGDFPISESICSRTLALPLYPDLSETGVHVVCDAIAKFYEE